MKARSAWAILVIALGSVVVRGDTTAPAMSAREAKGIDLAHDLAMLATGQPATAADLEQLAGAGYTSQAFSHYIEDLVKRPQVPRVALSLLRIVGGTFRSTFAETILRTEQVGGDTIYYIHKACDAKDAVRVKPWWDLSSSVLVCPEAYRPDVFQAADGNYCSGVQVAAYNDDSPCGCGPNLMRCVRDKADKDAFEQAIGQEALGTIGWVINHDMPLETLFTSVESFRPPLAEYLYRRWRVENREVPSLEAMGDWRSWPKEGQWAPRYEAKPGQHAGILTNHFTHQSVDSLRLKVSGFEDLLWCQPQDSLRVQTAAVLEVGDKVHGNLRSKVGWEELAARPVCTGCHARIDYGVQFFTGIHWYFNALHYVPATQQDTPGPMFIRDINDRRGEAPRNPQGFVKLAMAQPEFPACMARDFLEHVFSTASDPELHDIDEQLRTIVEKKGTYRELLRTTLEAYKDRALGTQAQRAPEPAPANESARLEQIAKTVDDRCGSCHDPDDGEPPGVVLEHGARWCKAAGGDCEKLGVEMISAVMFERMPKDAPLGARDKRAFFDLLAPVVWRDPAARAEAEHYFVTITQAPHVHALAPILAWIKSVRTPAAPLPAMPPVVPEPTFSVTTAAQAGITAAALCADAADRKACLDQAMALGRFEK